MLFVFSSTASNETMAELCEIGKCRYYAEIDSMRNARGMFDTLLKNDEYEENEASFKKFAFN